VLAALIVLASVLAMRNALTLIAEPQGREWQLVQLAANRLRLTNDTQVFIIRPSIDYRSTERAYADEFGTLTSDADWAARELFKAAMRERFPSGLPDVTTYTLWTSFGVPPPQYTHALVVDLRELRSLGARAPAKATASQR
jgi:hypothetical protein